MVRCVLTDCGAEGRNPLSKGEECRGGHKQQFLSPVKCWCVSMCSSPARLGQRGGIMNIFLVSTCRRCQSCGKCCLEIFRWVSVLTTPAVAWQGTLTVLWWHYLTPAHTFDLFAWCTLILFSVAPTQWTVPRSMYSSYLFCPLSQMWQFEVEATVHAGKLHTLETICLETWNC